MCAKKGLQDILYILYSHCKSWNIDVNVAKSKDIVKKKFTCVIVWPIRNDRPKLRKRTLLGLKKSEIIVL